MLIDELIRDNFLKKILKKKNSACLEIGCSNYRQTKIIKKFYNKIYSIDKFDYKKRISSKKIVFQKIEAEKFNIPYEVKDIFFLGTIEHLTKPKIVLNKIINHLKKNNGNLYLMINNKYSLHRLLGYQMGLIKNLDSFTKSEKNHGHNFIFGENFFDNYFDKKNFIYKKNYIGIKPLPTLKMKGFIKEKDFKKIMFPRSLKKNSAYIFYKAKLKNSN